MTLGKIKFAVILIIALVLVSFIIATNILASKNKKLMLELELETTRYSNCSSLLNNQNSAIEAAKINIDKLNSDLAAIKASANKERIKVVTQYTKDPSCENELRIIKSQLGRLYEIPDNWGPNKP